MLFSPLLPFQFSPCQPMVYLLMPLPMLFHLLSQLLSQLLSPVISPVISPLQSRVAGPGFTVRAAFFAAVA